LCYELKQRGINFDRQEKLEIFYKDWLIPRKYKIDLSIVLHFLAVNFNKIENS